MVTNQNVDEENWPFDQAPHVAAITTRQVVDLHFPIRQVTHYFDDHSWAFMCGTTAEVDDYRAIHMGHVLSLDEGLRDIADLQPGWSAWRESGTAPWQRYREEELM